MSKRESATVEAVLDDWRGYGAFTLGALAECWVGDPDGLGGKFLTDVRDAVIEAVEYNRDDLPTDGDWSDWVHEIADDAVPTYTLIVWHTFTDLRAWNVDIDELGDALGADESMTTQAQWALYVIARSVAWAMLGMLDEADR